MGRPTSTHSGQRIGVASLPICAASLPIGLAEIFHQAGEHAADFDYFLLAENEVAAWDNIGIGGELEMIFDLGCGGEGDLEKLFSATACAFLHTESRR